MAAGFRKAFIAIEAVVYISCQAKAQPVRSREICQYMGIPVRYLEHMLQKLVHDGFLRGVRGPKGGYVLAKERRKIKLGDIFNSVMELEIHDKDQVSSSKLHAHIIKPFSKEAQKALVEYLDKRSLQELCDEVGEHGLPLDKSEKSDFTI